jgi:hypothetical protein
MYRLSRSRLDPGSALTASFLLRQSRSRPRYRGHQRESRHPRQRCDPCVPTDARDQRGRDVRDGTGAACPDRYRSDLANLSAASTTPYTPRSAPMCPPWGRS